MIAAVGGSAALRSGGAEGSFGAGTLGRDAFLALLVAELRNQNPLEPLKNENLLSQLAAFDSLDQMHQVKEALTALAQVQVLAQGAALVGRNVEAEIQGQILTGLVQEAALDQAGSLYLLVEGSWVPLAAVRSVW